MSTSSGAYGSAYLRLEVVAKLRKAELVGFSNVFRGSDREAVQEEQSFEALARDRKERIEVAIAALIVASQYQEPGVLCRQKARSECKGEFWF